ncbi:MAG: Holliday junction resolvase RecU [Lachnospiraceae bacterium]|nr:Holliday junction resolvase RecU [Lachnospiraceae bacterium]
MAWSTRGLRGSTFEELINRTNEKYKELGLALVQKIPTPITPIKIDQEKRHITLAYFEQKSTVDYIGVIQGLAVCFDAKESDSDTFPLQNIHAHQMDFMSNFEKQEGIAFILIYFTKHEDFYYLRYEELEKFWNRMLDGGRKSFRRDELDNNFFFKQEDIVFVPYLESFQKDLDIRD